MSEESNKLQGQEAIDLFNKGHLEWNAWVSENPNTEINFSNLDLSTLKNEDECISFEKYNFPKQSTILFNRTIFNAKHISFVGVDFNSCYLSFENSKFTGEVDFSGSKCNSSSVITFEKTIFKKQVLFEYVTYAADIISFKKAEFEDNFFATGDKSSYFGNGLVSFDEARFTNGTGKQLPIIRYKVDDGL